MYVFVLFLQFMWLQGFIHVSTTFTSTLFSLFLGGKMAVQFSKEAEKAQKKTRKSAKRPLEVSHKLVLISLLNN